MRAISHREDGAGPPGGRRRVRGQTGEPNRLSCGTRTLNIKNNKDYDDTRNMGFV